jgi:hypothetical protein
MKLTALPVLLLLVIASLGVSCKKKEIKPGTTISGCMDTTFVDNFYNDTIFPSEYLMTYPGSEWNYDNGTTVTCDAWENVAFAVPTVNDQCVTITKDYHFLPHCSSEPRYIDYNKNVTITNPNKTKSTPLLDTVLGVFYQDSYTLGGPPPYEVAQVYRSFEVIEKLNSMDVLSVTYSDVIHVRINVQEYSDHFTPYTYDYYYAKNVGLIRYSYTYEPNDPPITEKNLVSYIIGPH